ncbi:helix-turn-helix transcriptional regulator [Agromyces sp. H66]|uniref:helix-turn-helix domain-containing protein n=1 Tax=Agromyces sp. H66 TaxID=2529859 RepID=UPI00145A215D|nr:helix-turn-helix transcriptional regulator [Agromyces sp. H66]
MSNGSVFPTGDSDFDAVYAEEAAMVDASELIAAALVECGMKKSELAERLGVSKSEISARLAGERNITVRTLAATLHALGQRLELSLESGLGRPAHTARSEWRFPSDEQHLAAPHPRASHGWALPTRAAR